MEKQQTEEWRLLQEEAIRILRNDNRHDDICVLKLLTIPSCDSATSYEILKAKSPSPITRYLGIITRWRRDTDIAKFKTPVERLKWPASLTPTTEHQSFEIAVEEVEKILSEFRIISIPMLASTPSLGLDGTFYEIELKAGFPWSHFGWWEEPPAEWQMLKGVFQGTLTKLDAFASSQR